MRTLALALLISLLGTQAQAQALLDLATHNTLIQKLEGSVSDIEDKKTRAKIHVRLADLYSDRARIKHVENQLDSAKADREKAVEYYLEAYKANLQDQQSRILLQLGHQYNFLGEDQKVEKIFKNIVADKARRPKDLVGEAYAGLGELSFKRGEFRTARSHFQHALKYPIAKAIDVSQRLAWSEFNEGNYQTAEKLAIQNLQNSQITESQKKDISRDLSTFMAKGPISQKDIDRLLALSPRDVQKNNLFYLGQEADRLGNFKGSQIVWVQYTKFDDITDEEKAEIRLRKAQSFISEGHFKDGLQFYAEFFKDFKNLSCKKSEVCESLQIRSRSLVHNWIKKEKAAPSTHLRNGLMVYSVNNPQDVEMLKWTGNIARFQKQYKIAVDHYIQAGKAAKGKEQSEVLLALIQTAEEADKTDLMRTAYLAFLTIQPNSQKAGEVRYQLAYLLYREKKYHDAAKAFRVLADDKTLAASLRIQSADLSLDSLAAVNDSETIETYALHFANTFKASKVKYLTVARKAMVNWSVATFKAAKGDTGKIKLALAKLKKAPLTGASDVEKLGIYQNRIEMGSAARLLDEVDQAALWVLRNRKATAADKEAAQEKRLWVAESKLHFKTALSIAKQMHFPKLDAASKELKLGILTQLAGKNPRPHYQKYIKLVNDRRSANAIRLEMIRLAKNPWSQLADYKRALLSTPDLYTLAVVEAYGRKPYNKQLKKYAKHRLSNAHGAAALHYQLELDEFTKLKNQFRRLKLDSRTDARLARSLNHRLGLLGKTERYAQNALKRGHLGIQIRALDLLSREYQKLYMQIQGLPVPKGLKVAQRAEYKRLLDAKAVPFKQKADGIKAQTAELWKSNSQYKSMLAELENLSGGAKSLLIRDLNSLKAYAPNSVDREITAEIKSSQKSDHKRLVAEFDKLKRNPFDASQIAKLKKLEEKRGSTAMVAFLESREAALKRGKL